MRAILYSFCGGRNFSRLFALANLFFVSNSMLQAQNDPPASTNGVGITNGISSKSIQPIKKEDLKEFKKRKDALLKIVQTSPTDWDKFETGARALINDFPTRANGYEDMMILMEYYERAENWDKARALAKETIAGASPERFKLWAKGFLHRLDSKNKLTTIRFTAVDGREVDTARLKGKVVLVDFWATTCSPCVAELPRIKAVYDKLHSKGFEVIGISCDTDKQDLEDFVERKEIPWPQFFDGKQQESNKVAQGFGIDGIPHMFLLDKNGCLRADNLRADQKFEERVSNLLEEKMDQ